MNWDAISGLAEIFGTLAVLATLFYLARQIRQNTEEIRSANYHGVTDSFNEINLTLAGDPVLAKIFRVGNEDYDHLTDDEKYQYSFFMHSAFRVLDVISYQSQHGTGDMTLWDFERKTLDTLLATPGGRMWWRDRLYNFSEEFVSYVENEILAKYPDDT